MDLPLGFPLGAPSTLDNFSIGISDNVACHNTYNCEVKGYFEDIQFKRTPCWFPGELLCDSL